MALTKVGQSLKQNRRRPTFAEVRSEALLIVLQVQLVNVPWQGIYMGGRRRVSGFSCGISSYDSASPPSGTTGTSALKQFCSGSL